MTKKKKIAILQSNYIPWKGYFDMIASVDEFVLFDDMQFTKNDWRNRNKIKTRNGLKWLTIPVGQNIHRRIRDVVIQDKTWQKKHWHALQANYGRSRHFDEIANWLEPMYIANKYERLSQLNRQFIEEICLYLGIGTTISNSWDYSLAEGKVLRLVDLCAQVDATEYITGPAAKGYIVESVFEERGIQLTWFDYSEYPEYPQPWGEFTHGVTILDLLFNCGMDAHRFMKYV